VVDEHCSAGPQPLDPAGCLQQFSGDEVVHRALLGQGGGHVVAPADVAFDHAAALGKAVHLGFLGVVSRLQPHLSRNVGGGQDALPADTDEEKVDILLVHTPSQITQIIP